MAEIKNKPIGRTSDHYKARRTSPDRKQDLKPPPARDVPDFDTGVPDHSQDEERRREERGNRGPDEEPGFGQGA
jgi:hypothetical protein